MTGPDAVWDPGAQAERTALAWQRTGLAVAAVGLLLTHARSGGHLLAPWPGLVVLAAGGAVAAFLAPLRYRHIERTVRGGAGPSSAGMVSATALAVLAGIVGVGVLLVLG